MRKDIAGCPRFWPTDLWTQGRAQSCDAHLSWLGRACSTRNSGREAKHAFPDDVLDYVEHQLDLAHA